MGWVVDELVSLAVRTVGRGGDGTQPSLSPLLDAASLKLELREILFFFFFFFGVEIKCDLNSKTQISGKRPTEKDQSVLSVFLLASLWLQLPGQLHRSFLPPLSLFPWKPELSFAWWGF